MRGMNVLFAVVFTVLAVLAIAFGVYDLQNEQRTYSGKEVFSTEQEYTDFKTAVGEDGIKIKEMSALSSAPPIVVQFKIETSQPFGYGDKCNNGNTPAAVALFIGAGICCVIAVTEWYQLVRGEER